MVTTDQELIFQPTSDAVGGENVPEGLWLVEVVDLLPWKQEDTSSPFYSDEPQAKWIFRMTRPVHVPKVKPSAENPHPKEVAEFVGYELHDYSNLTMGKRSKARAWAEALLNRELEAGVQLSKGLLIGKRAVATVGRSQGGRHKITALTPVDDDETQTAAPATATAAPAQADGSLPGTSNTLPF